MTRSCICNKNLVLLMGDHLYNEITKIGNQLVLNLIFLKLKEFLIHLWRIVFYGKLNNLTCRPNYRRPYLRHTLLDGLNIGSKEMLSEHI